MNRAVLFLSLMSIDSGIVHGAKVIVSSDRTDGYYAAIPLALALLAAMYWRAGDEPGK